MPPSRYRRMTRKAPTEPISKMNSTKRKFLESIEPVDKGVRGAGSAMVSGVAALSERLFARRKSKATPKRNRFKRQLRGDLVEA